MTRDDIIRMAREASGGTDWWTIGGDTLERFAALVAADECKTVVSILTRQCASMENGDDFDFAIWEIKRRHWSPCEEQYYSMQSALEYLAKELSEIANAQDGVTQRSQISGLALQVEEFHDKVEEFHDKILEYVEHDACAEICDANADFCNYNFLLRDMLRNLLAGSAGAIRARGEV